MASKPLSILVDAAELFWAQLQRDFDAFWSSTWGAYTDMVRRILTFDLPPGLGLISGTAALGIDTLGTILDGVSTFLSALAVGPFLSVAQSLAANFEAPGLKSKVVTLDKAVQSVSLLILDRARTVMLNPGSTWLVILQTSMNSAGWQTKLVNLIKGRFENVLLDRLKKLVRSFVFLLLQVIVVIGQIGFAAGMMLVVFTIQNDAQNKVPILALPALRQSKRRRRRRRPGYTREVVSQRL